MRSSYCTVEANYRHTQSRSLSATAVLLVSFYYTLSHFLAIIFQRRVQVQTSYWSDIVTLSRSLSRTIFELFDDE